MKDKGYLDKVIKSAIDDSIFNIKASRDIFNEAWNNKEKEMGKKKYFGIKNIRKEVLVPICCVLFAIVGVFTFSPGARAAAQEALKTIFYLINQVILLRNQKMRQLMMLPLEVLR